jgi:hypothetical protein
LLTADLVRARRRAGRLELSRPRGAARARMVEMAARYIELAEQHVGAARAVFSEACADAEATFRATDRKLAEGLKKLVSDRCSFEQAPEVDPPALRRALFSRASARRRELDVGAELDRAALLAEIAHEHGLSPGRVEEGLYADLKAAHLLTGFDPISAAALVALYERSQEQAVLLRATRVSVHLRDLQPAGLRRFFNTLKFRRLLFTLAPHPDGGYLLEIDGPLSLFQAVTKYGVQLAHLVPALELAGRWTLDAKLRWGREREPLDFHLEGGEVAPFEAAAGDTPGLPDEVAKLVERFRRLETAWEVAPAEQILDLPGVGLCVPDLVFTHATRGARVFLEVMGFWSRDAVWRRVELVERGLPHRILFAVSQRLRVSEAALAAELPGALYVYKGSMNAKALAERLDRVL